MKQSRSSLQIPIVERAGGELRKPQRFGSVALETVHRNDRNTKQRNP